MTRRFAIAIAGFLVSGCANDGARQWASQWAGMQHLGAGSLNVVASAVAADQRHAPEPTAGTVRKSLGDKVLSAMALERATGRKPDPARLRELD